MAFKTMKHNVEQIFVTTATVDKFPTTSSPLPEDVVVK